MDLKLFSKWHSSPHGDRSESNSRDRSAIKSHPLFPILEYLFFKCEHSTSSLTSANTHVDTAEMLAMVASAPDSGQSCGRLETTGTWRSGNDELDQLMLRAIQVLRIQLLELEKVDELCKDFCGRYITCLKGKVTQEMLLGWSDLGDDESCSPPSPSSPSLFNGADTSTDPSSKSQSAIVATMQTPNGQVSIPLLIPFLISPATTDTRSASTFSTPLDLRTNTKSSTVINRSSNKSSTNTFSASSNLIAQTERANLIRPPAHPASTDSVSGDKTREVADSGTVTNGAGKGKRGSLPRKAVDVLRSWLFQNIRHPYPSEEEKRDLCTQSGLNLLQVNNWFINARRRILQPLLDGTTPSSLGTLLPAPSTVSSPPPQQMPQSEPSSSTSSPDSVRMSARKRTLPPKARSAARYWPESLVPKRNGSCDQSDSESPVEMKVERKRKGDTAGHEGTKQIVRENR